MHRPLHPRTTLVFLVAGLTASPAVAHNRDVVHPHLSREALELVRHAVGVAFVLALTVALSGCMPWVGPIHFRIETDGERYDDFMVIPFETFVGGIHSSHTRARESFIAPSEEEVTMGPWFRWPTFTGAGVGIYHPVFHGLASSRDRLRGGPFELPTLHPRRWDDYLSSTPAIPYDEAAMHLERLRDEYLQHFPPGSRAELADYVPVLVEIVDHVHWTAVDTLRWPNEREAQRYLDSLLEHLTQEVER